MLNDPGAHQYALEMVTLESLAPSDHLLRQIDAFIDFEFIRDKVRHLYCIDNGRPAVDPVVSFKLLFIGDLYGIRSERQIVKDVQVNVAYRWFLGFSLTDKIPDASTISQNRRRRFVVTSIYQEIFDAIVEQALNTTNPAKKTGLVSGLRPSSKGLFSFGQWLFVRCSPLKSLEIGQVGLVVDSVEVEH